MRSIKERILLLCKEHQVISLIDIMDRNKPKRTTTIYVCNIVRMVSAKFIYYLLHSWFDVNST